VGGGSKSGFDGVSSVHPAAIGPIARDAARLLAGFFPPGSTTLSVDTGSPFGKALEDALRQRGFMVSASGVPIRYQLDMLNGAVGICYLTLRLPDGKTISQSYSLHGGQVVANSAVAAATNGLPFMEPREPSVHSVPLPPPPPPVAEPSVQLELVSPAASSLGSGMTRIVTVAVRQNGLPVPGATVQFDGSQAYPNLRTVLRRADADGRIILNGLQIRDISVPLTAMINGQHRVQFYLASPPPLTTNVAPALAALNPEPAATPALVLAPLILPALEPEPLSAPIVVESPAPPPLIAVPYFPLPVAIEESWTVSPGLLREQIAGWASQAGYQLIWKASSDFDLFSGATFRGSFITAVEELFTRLHVHGNPLRVEIYESNQVIEVNED